MPVGRLAERPAHSGRPARSLSLQAPEVCGQVPARSVARAALPMNAISAITSAKENMKGR